MSAQPAENQMESGVLPPARRSIVFLTMIVAIGAVVMDGIAVAVALPTIAQHFSISETQSIWVINIYQLLLIIGLLPIAALADKIGYRRVYILGLVSYAVLAACSALAPSFDVLIAARAAQGAAAACVMSVNLALIRTIFPEKRLGSALGINATAGAIASATGPAIAGFLIDFASWQWIFAVGIPATLCAACVSFFAQKPSVPRDVHFDVGSALLSALTFGGILLGISSLGHHWHPLIIALQFAIGIGAGVALVRRMNDVPDPLFPLDLLSVPPFAFSVCVSICAFAAQMLAFVSLPFEMQTKMGFSAVDAGLIFMSWPLALAFTAPVAGLLADRVPQDGLSGLGLTILSLGLFLLATMGIEATRADLVVRMVLCGVGFGLFQTPNNRILLGSAPRWRASAAGASMGTARLLGQALGTALAALALVAGSTGSARVAFWGALGFAACGVSITLLRRIRS